MGDVETGHGDIHRCTNKPSKFLKVADDTNDKKKCSSTTEKSKKASKPPRHPRGPSLDETDRRFIEELLLKRIKTERLKELKRLDDSSCAGQSWLKRTLSYVVFIILVGFIALIHIMQLGA